MMWLSSFFIVVEALAIQAGPFLSQMGIDDGISKKDWTALTIIGVLAILAVVISAVASGFRVATTGRVASRVMFELRVRVFAHLQRLSLDYFTEEKAGVIMTRMTSDIESLQQLLQDGLPQLALQGLTMLVVTVILFFYNVELALITLVLIVPALTGAVAVVPHDVRSRVRAGTRRHRQRAQRPLREPVGRARRHRLQPGPQQRVVPPQRVGRVPRRQRPHRAPRRHLRRVDRVRRADRPGDAAARRRQHGARRQPHHR